MDRFDDKGGEKTILRFDFGFSEATIKQLSNLHFKSILETPEKGNFISQDELSELIMPSLARFMNNISKLEPAEDNVVRFSAFCREISQKIIYFNINGMNLRVEPLILSKREDEYILILKRRTIFEKCIKIQILQDISYNKSLKNQSENNITRNFLSRRSFIENLNHDIYSILAGEFRLDFHTAIAENGSYCPIAQITKIHVSHDLYLANFYDGIPKDQLNKIEFLDSLSRINLDFKFDLDLLKVSRGFPEHLKIYFKAMKRRTIPF